MALSRTSFFSDHLVIYRTLFVQDSSNLFMASMGSARSYISTSTTFFVAIYRASV